MTEDRGQTETMDMPDRSNHGSAIPQSACAQRLRVQARVQGAIRNPQSEGFTLIELLIVMAIMGILIAIAAPNLSLSLIKAREAVLKENLFQLREAIDQYYADNNKYPDTLEDLITAQDKSKSYLRAIPKDPFTSAADWITVSPEGGEEGGVFDVHSASPLVALDGTTYNSW